MALLFSVTPMMIPIFISSLVGWFFLIIIEKWGCQKRKKSSEQIRDFKSDSGSNEAKICASNLHELIATLIVQLCNLALCFECNMHLLLLFNDDELQPSPLWSNDISMFFWVLAGLHIIPEDVWMHNDALGHLKTWFLRWSPYKQRAVL